MTFGERFFDLLIRRRYSLLIILCATIYLPNLGGYLLFDVDEPRYAETASVMHDGGDWVVPYFNGEYRFEKPVLTLYRATLPFFFITSVTQVAVLNSAPALQASSARNGSRQDL